MSSSNLSSCFPRQAEPDAAWASDVETPWWKDSSYVLGCLTAKTRRIKLLNMLKKDGQVYTPLDCRRSRPAAGSRQPCRGQHPACPRPGHAGRRACAGPAR